MLVSQVKSSLLPSPQTRRFIQSPLILHPNASKLTNIELNDLYVDPAYQRQGIGTKLLEEGLKDVDERGLQCVLGSSKEGKGVYKRFGFVEVETMVIDLEEYGGVGMGMDEHVLMNRPGRR